MKVTSLRLTTSISLVLILILW